MAEAYPNTGEIKDTASPGAAEPIDPRSLLTPGWWYADLRAEDTAAWTAWTKANPSVQVTKTSGTAAGHTWVLFQVTGNSPVVYTLPGRAYKAIKGSATEVEDYLANQADLEAAANVGNFGKDLEAFMALLKTVGKVALWGGAAILLLQLYVATKPAPRSSPKQLPSGDADFDDEPRRSSRLPTIHGAHRRAY